MSIRQDITADDPNPVFAGTDRVLEFEMLALDVDGLTLIPVNVTGRALMWVMRKQATDAAIVLTKATGSGVTITGAFNASRLLNTQRVLVALAAGDTRALLERHYVFALKRTDSGLEDVYAFGDLALLVPAAR